LTDDNRVYKNKIEDISVTINSNENQE